MRSLFLSVVAAAALVAPVPAQTPPPSQTPQTPPAAPGAAQPQRPPRVPLGPNEWAIDGNHSAATFSVKHNVVTTVRGTLGRITGKLEYDGVDIKTVKADVSIDMNGINTQNEGRTCAAPTSSTSRTTRR
jgi:polyisoprenoid-binding protein YceI